MEKERSEKNSSKVPEPSGQKKASAEGRTSFSERRSREVLKEAGIRLTEPRVKILQVIAESEEALDAEEILDLANQGEEAFWLSTVYRNLELFAEKGLIQEVRRPGSDVLYYRTELRGHNHYAVCERCRKEIPLDICPIDTLEDQLKEKGFTPTHHRLEIYGLCAECKEKLRHLRENKREK